MDILMQASGKKLLSSSSGTPKGFNNIVDHEMNTLQDCQVEKTTSYACGSSHRTCLTSICMACEINTTLHSKTCYGLRG